MGCGGSKDQRQIEPLTIGCDVCAICPIVGKRFTCQVCVDYDLCQECYEKGSRINPTHVYPCHPEHEYLQIGW